MPFILTDIGISLAVLGAWLQLWDRHNEFSLKLLAAGGVFLLAGWGLT
jgi:hypothetical protein